jgi:NTE family protein
MRYLCDHDLGMPLEEKLSLFRQSEHLFGRPALMLSGGGAFGIFHIGVLKALWEAELLPDILSGSSMGAVIASGLSTRTHEEVGRLLCDTASVINRVALRWLSPREALHRGGLMDQAVLLRHIYDNVGDYTFRAAWERSGKVLNITVSPTRKRQKLRILNHLSAPDVLVPYAALASSAVPGLFPPVELRARRDGIEVPYMAGETWVDGSVSDDLPMARMSRLHSVNLFVVSQANPHVIPSIQHHRGRGWSAALRHVANATLHANVANLFSLARTYWPLSPARNIFEKMYALASQSYLGDINIQMPFRLGLYSKVMKDPSVEDLEYFCRLGQQETWPRIEMIRNQTKISRVFTECIQRLEARIPVSR